MLAAGDSVEVNRELRVQVDVFEFRLLAAQAVSCVRENMRIFFLAQLFVRLIQIENL